jgi:IS30 family transposase
MRKGTRFKQLTYEDRIRIDALRRTGKGVREIARRLGRSPNTIWRELSVKAVQGTYTPGKAQRKTYHKRHLAKRACMKVALDPRLTRLVLEKLPLRWFPERIAGYARREGTLVSKKAIYRFIKSRFLNGHLLWKGRKRKGRGDWHRTYAAKDKLKRPVSKRPKADTTGHWEVDFIVSWASVSVLFVAVDRFTRFTVVRTLPHKKYGLVLAALTEVKDAFGMKSITVDNDFVFTRWRDMEAALEARFFFTSPFRSWEKGLVEIPTAGSGCSCREEVI